MLFLVQCTDKPNAGTLRPDTRPAHLRYLDGFMAGIVIAGPALAVDHQTPTGTVLAQTVATPPHGRKPSPCCRTT